MEPLGVVTMGKPENRWRSKGVLIGFILALVLSIPGQSVFAQRLITIVGAIPNQFPAKVGAIVFGDGIQINSSEMLGFGDWAIGFGPNQPKAYYRYESPFLEKNPPPRIVVENLVCDSPLAGGADCELTVTLHKIGPPDCAIAINGEASNTVLIDCPIQIESP
jgi:hypothetical protein